MVLSVRSAVLWRTRTVRVPIRRSARRLPQRGVRSSRELSGGGRRARHLAHKIAVDDTGVGAGVTDGLALAVAGVRGGARFPWEAIGKALGGAHPAGYVPDWRDERDRREEHERRARRHGGGARYAHDEYLRDMGKIGRLG
jgi:hypothetical protein